MTQAQPAARNTLDRYPWALPLAMAVLTLALFGDTLVTPGRVPALPQSDLRVQYLYWRQFAFDQLRAGHVPLWNPYTFAGTPFLADPQSAMFYPPNWLNLFLAPIPAADWLIVIHFFLAGYFTGLWCRRHGASVAAAIMAGTLYTCCGPVITNLRPGHLPLLCSAAWTPLLLICVDAILDGRHILRWTMLGIAVVVLLATDGYPQFAYYTALASGMYALLRLLFSPSPAPQSSVIGSTGLAAGSPQSLRSLLAIALMFFGGWLISAAQILPTAEFANESNRGGGLTSQMAGSFSLPPENLLTLLVPGLFGDTTDVAYYGRWFWWETCVFLGPAALVLAVYGIRRATWIPAVMAVLLAVFALGMYTPVFDVLYRFLPGFASFRGTTRFSLLSLLFLILLAAHGFDRLAIHAARKRWALAWVLVGLLLGAAALWARNTEANGPGGFTRILQAMGKTGQDDELRWSFQPAFPAIAALFAAQQLAIASLATLVSAMLIVSKFRKFIAVLAIGQIIYFAASQRVNSDHYVGIPLSWKNALKQVHPPRRILLSNLALSNAGYRLGFLNVSGYNPLTLDRTTQLLAAIQYDNSRTTIKHSAHANLNVFRLFRCATALLIVDNYRVFMLDDPLPHLLLMRDYAVETGTDAAVGAVLNDSFDPGQTVILESPPQPAPAAGADGSVKLLSETTDSLEIEADLPSPRILLVTDAYAKGWRVVPLDSDEQSEYHVIPADVCLRAIPLAAGHHHFRLEYRPRSVIAGAWISLSALAVYAICLSRLARPARAMPGKT